MSDPEEQPTTDDESAASDDEATDETALDEDGGTESTEDSRTDGGATDDVDPTAMPEPTAEEPQLLPGGADSIDDPKYGDTPGESVPRDLDPESNPAIGEEDVPDEIKEPEDKQQEPSNGDADLDAGEPGESEDPA